MFKRLVLGILAINAIAIGLILFSLYPSVAASDYLTGWHHEVQTMSMLLVIFVIVSLLFLLIFRRQWTSRLEASHEVSRNEQLFRSVVENAHDIFFVLTMDGVFAYISPNWTEAFGYEVSETIGKPFIPFVHPDDVAGCYVALQNVLTSGKKRNGIEYRVLTKDGNWLWYSANGSILRDEDNATIYFLGIGRDISALKQSLQDNLTLERQFLHAQKLESLGLMAGGIAHDFNNLLHSMLGNLELAARLLDPDSPLQEYISQATISGKHATHLTSLMLTYAGGGQSEKKLMQLNELIAENVDILKPAATASVTVELSLAETLPPVMADHAQIQQVVMNLLTNAAESIEKQPGKVCIRTGVVTCDESVLSKSRLKEKPAPGMFVMMEVQDNGCGMSEEVLERMFDPFFTTKFTGRGLGMSAVLGIVKAHDGVLFLKSEPGNGSLFTVLLPAVDTGGLQPAVSDDVVPGAAGECSADLPCSGLVLIADDEKHVLKVCARMVALCGFKVITASNGVEAVAKYRVHSDEIVAVLLDMTMPNMDGVTAMDEIHRIKDDARVILSSGYSEGELGDKITTRKQSGFIRKPYNMGELERELRRVVNSSGSR